MLPTPPISDERFWALIQEARDGGPASARPAALKKVLQQLSDVEVSVFGHLFYEKLSELNLWRLWAAGYIIAGGMGDDSFHYFRSWIIGKGKTLYNLAKSNPDEIGPWIDDPDVDNELLEYVAVDIMQQRGGPDPREASDCHPDAEPRGEPFVEEELAALCPKLAAQFA